MSIRVTVWRCIGCGRIEGPRACVGICEDRKDEIIFAADHEAELDRVRRQVESLAAVLRRIAFTTPRNGEFERTWNVLQVDARGVLEAIPDGP